MYGIENLDSDPAFQKLSYAAQTEVRKRYFEKGAMADAAYAQLSPAAKQIVYDRAVNVAPAYESVDATQRDFVKRAQDVVSRMQAGDTSAVNDAVTGVALRNTLKSSFIASLAARGVDAIGEAFDPTRPRDEITSGYFGKDSQKTVDWLNANISRYGGAAATANVQGASTAGALGLGFLETALLGGGLIGTAEKGGALTAKLFGEGGALAKAISGIKSAPLHNLARSQVPGLAEAVAYGTFGTVENIGREALQGELGQTDRVEWLGKVVRDFGVETATNYVGWALARGVAAAVRSQIKTVKGFKTQASMVDEATIRNAMTGSLDELAAVRVASPEIRAQWTAQMARKRVTEFDPKDIAGFDTYAKANGWVPTFYGKQGERVALESAVDPTVTLPVMSRREAAMRIAETASAGAPATTAAKADPLKRLATTTNDANVLRETLVGTLSQSAKSKDLMPLLMSGDEASVRTFTRAVMRERGMSPDAIEHVTVRLDDVAGRAPATHASEIVLPKSLSTIADERAFAQRLFDGVERAARASGLEASPAATRRAEAFLEAFGSRKARAGGTSPQALDFVAQRQLNATLRDAPHGGFDLVDSAGAQLAHFATADDATRGIYTALVDKGVTSIAHLNAVLQPRTGMSVTVAKRALVDATSRAQRYVKGDAAATTVDVFRLTVPWKRSDGTWGEKLVGEAESLDELLTAHPDVDPRLPSTLAPATFLITDEVRLTVEAGANVAHGRLAALTDFASAFDDTMSARVVHTVAGPRGEQARLVEMSSVRYDLVNDALGTRQSFYGDTAQAALSKARASLTRTQNAYDSVVDAIALKGLRTRVTPDGRIAVVGPQGVEGTFATLEELRTWMAKTPMASWANDILGTNFAGTAETVAAVTSAMGDITRALPKRGVRRTVASAWAHEQMFLGTTESAFDAMGRVSGNAIPGQIARQFRNTIRVVDGVESRLGQVRSAVFSGTNDKLNVKIAAAAKWPEATRAARWQAVFGEAMPAKAAETLMKMRTYYDSLARVGELDPHKFVNDYLPKIRSFLEANQDFIIDDNPATFLMQAVYGQGAIPSELKVFSEMMRTTDVARMALMDDAFEIAEAYTHSIVRAQYINPMLKELKPTVDRMLSGATRAQKNELEFLADTLAILQGGPRSRGDAILREMEERAGQALTNALRRVPLFGKMIDPTATPESLMKALNYRVTLATQATKPWTPLRDMMQVTNLSAIFDSSTPWKVAQTLLRDDAALDTVMRKMYRIGSAQERLPYEQAKASRSLWQRALMRNQNANNFTRAVAWRSAESWYDDALARLRSGTIDSKQFTRETRLQLLNRADQEIVVNAVLQKADDVGRDAYADAITRLTMYDESKVAKPLAARGFMGSLFGKFGTFPMSTISLYGKLLSSGSIADRLGMALRLVGSTTAVYEAFKAAGVDYQGFQWSDPFSFQGGPLWTILMQTPDLVGDDTQAKATRTKLLKSLPRILSPTYAFGAQVAKALQYFEAGEVTGGINALNGAPVRADIMTRAGFTPYR